jgi:hypothetical protein
MLNKKIETIVMLAILIPFGVGQLWANDDNNQSMLSQGLLGAGVGAIAASSSGGKAGKGALVGAGTNILGSMLLGKLGNNQRSSSRYRQASYDQSRQTASFEGTPRYTQSRQIPYPERTSRYDQVNYDKGYREGYREGYEVAYQDAMRDSSHSRS